MMTTLEIFLDSPISQIWMREKENKDMIGYMHPELVIKYVCDFFCANVEDVLSKKRNYPCVLVRHFCMYVMRKKTKLSLKEIGEQFDRDHTSVIHAVRSIDNYSYSDSDIKDYVTLLMRGVHTKVPIDGVWKFKRYTQPYKKKITKTVTVPRTTKKSREKRPHEPEVTKVMIRHPGIYSNHSPLGIAK